MCKTQCLLAFAALCASLVHSWDIAVTSGDKLEFYGNNKKIDSEGVQFRDLTALAYDAVHNMLLFVDKQSDNASIFSYHIATRKYQSLVRRKSTENIQGLAFDPVKGMLFWTDSNDRSIYWISMQPGYKNDVYGNLLIKMDDEIPKGIAVDSCRGYIYWTNTNISKATIERARFDGSEREVIISRDIYMPVSVAIDQQARKLYWADDKEGIHYSIESSDLDGKNREKILHGQFHQPNYLTVSKDSIYWVDWAYKSVWQLPKNHENKPTYDEPAQLVVFRDEKPFGIAANYSIEDQTHGIPECEALTTLSRNKTGISESFHIPADVGLFCVHGVKVNGKLECKCTPGYTGERCDISVCQNFCLHGDCSLSTDGQPKCRCKTGYYGERCEFNICHGFCLNQGACSMNGQNEPFCECSKDYEGPRCETPKVTIATTEIQQVVSNDTCNCTAQENGTAAGQLYRSSSFGQSEDDVIESCDGGWDYVRDPIIMALGTMCGFLCLACAVLITKILHLKRRPRIKKRIIVNKNVTPMTARPDQCEITIENCCNMNICETPCFEPRSTIRPTLLDAKPGKEEKRNLIANMEYPDDPY